METRTFGRVTVTLPGLETADVQLAAVDSLSGRGILQDFDYPDAEPRTLGLTDAALLTGRVTGLHAQRTQLEQVRIDTVEFADCDLGTASWTDGDLSRVSFHDCRLLGASLHRVTLDNVLFERCRLDYAVFERVRATGPLVFSRCVLSEAAFDRCDLTGAVFDDCVLRLTEFGPGGYRDCDLRGSDLSALRGTAALSQVIIDRAQQLQLAAALTAELDVTFGDDLADDDPADQR